MVSSPVARDPDDVINLVTHRASRSQRWVASVASLMLVALALVTFPIVRHALPEVSAYLPAFVVMNLVICCILTSQFRISRAPALAVLANLYLCVGLMPLPQLLPFLDAAIGPALPSAVNAPSLWCWVFCHTVFPLGVLSFLVAERCRGHLQLPRGRLNALTLWPPCGVLALVAGLTFVVFRFSGALPTIIRDDDYTTLVISGIGPVVWGLNAAVFAVMLLLWRGRTVSHLWLTVAALAMLLDVTLTFLGAHRFSVGWFLGEVNSLAGAGVVFVAFLFETHNQYGRAVGQGRELRAIFDSSPVGIARVDLEGRTLETNPALRALLGLNTDTMHIVPLDALMPPADAMRDCEYRVELLTGTRDQYHLETRLRPQAGQEFWGQIHVSLVRGRRGEPLYFVALVQDVSARKQHEESITWQAYHDPLTRLPNRRMVEEWLAQFDLHSVWARLAVIYLDLNGFKQVNDTLGHEAGDGVLREVARRLAGCVRADDLAARIGGDEFVLVLAQLAERSEVDTIVERVRAVLAQPILVSGQPVMISASIGASLFPDNGADLSTLIASADAAMYREKTGFHALRSAMLLNTRR